MIFMDDADNIVFSSVTKGEKVYDFELMQDGGSITGWLVADTEKLAKAAEKLGDEAVLQRKYGSADNAIILPWATEITVLPPQSGTGKRSKKLCRSRNTKPHLRAMRLPSLLTSTMRQLRFEPIHKVVFDTAGDLLPRPRPFFADNIGEGRNIDLVTGGGIERQYIRAYDRQAYRKMRGTSAGRSPSATADISTISRRLFGALKISQRWLRRHSLAAHGKIGAVFSSVMKSGPFPKSFSISHGNDKRYYTLSAAKSGNLPYIRQELILK